MKFATLAALATVTTANKADFPEFSMLHAHCEITGTEFTTDCDAV